MNKSFRASKLWSELQSGLFNDVENLDLSHFREPKNLNNRLASWDPFDSNSCRYYKNILFNLVTSMPEKFFSYYKKIRNTSLGNPVYVNVNDIKINLDYVFSVQEIIFLENHLEHVDIITEIGGDSDEPAMRFCKIFLTFPITSSLTFLLVSNLP